MGTADTAARHPLHTSFRGARTRLAVLLAALLVYFFLLETSVLAGWGGRPWWGIDAVVPTSGGAEVRWLEPNGLAWTLGLRPGDVLVAADGSTLAASYTRLNETSRLEYRRSGQVGSYAIRQPAATRGERLASFSATAVSLFFVVAGAIVYLRATDRRQARAFGLLCGITAASIVCVPAGVLGHPWAVRLTFLGLTLLPAVFARVFLVFPQKYPLKGRCSTIVPSVLASGPIAVVLLYLLALNYGLGWFEWTVRLGYVNMLVGFGAGLYFLLRNYFGERGPRVRQRARIVVGGTVLGILPVLLPTIIPKGFASWSRLAPGSEGYILPPELTVLGTVLIPLSFCYAILKHELFQADAVIRRSVIYFSITLAVTAAYLLVVIVSQTLYGLFLGQSSAIVFVAAALLVALLIEPIRRTTEDLVERLFFSDLYAYRQLLRTSGPLFSSILSAEELVPLIFGTVSAALPVNRLALFFAEDDDYRLRWDTSGPRKGEVVLSGRLAPVVEAKRKRGAVIARPPIMWKALDSPRNDAGRPARGAWRPVEEDEDSSETMVYVLVPLVAGGRVIAYLALGPRLDGEHYSGADLDFLDAAADRYAVALENMMLHETVRRQADTDALTGLYNHRFLLDRLSLEVEAARELGRPLSLLMMDINSFKFFNDTFGHPVGDRILMAVAQAMRGACREADTLGRYGGDEFVVILPNTTREQATAIADRLSAVVQEICFHVTGGGPIALSLSIGIAALPEDGESSICTRSVPALQSLLPCLLLLPLLNVLGGG